MFKNVIFDMDGVLIDSEEAIRIACITMFAEMGITAQHEDFIPFTGMGENRFIGGVAEKYGVEFQPAMKARAYEIYGEIAPDKVVRYEDIPQLVASLKSSGISVAVASAADLVKVTINLRVIGLSPDDFGGVVTGSDVKNKKPDPEIFLKAAQLIGADPAETVVIEDAISGCQGAIAAGMQCIGVTSCFSSQALKDAGSFATVDKTKDIFSVIVK